ncbi:palmitoyl-acyl carrier protein thioesterase, chloroplastic-like [Iris pallida]|uniref:Palmitoyl-acyl carrier protein thioesterase, chloroplastic-like n=1 Tax=Iris pallida TaxID=29817 RepID=A0AAX6GVH5_IRIPA|nr:palmitoyl-acyl carrier protein thioesterase, chloroplastic-like [Iris pallida]
MLFIMKFDKVVTFNFPGSCSVLGDTHHGCFRVRLSLLPCPLLVFVSSSSSSSLTGSAKPSSISLGKGPDSDVRGLMAKPASSSGSLQVKVNAQAATRVNGSKVGLKTIPTSSRMHPLFRPPPRGPSTTNCLTGVSSLLPSPPSSWQLRSNGPLSIGSRGDPTCSLMLSALGRLLRMDFSTGRTFP